MPTSPHIRLTWHSIALISALFKQINRTFNHLLSDKSVATVFMSNLGIRSLDSNEYVLAKLPLKPHKSQHTITGEFSELVNEPIIGDPSDLARLIFVLKNVQAESQECESFGSEEELQQSICFHVSSIFDCSGEMATRTCLETVLNYGFFRLETDAVSGRKRSLSLVWAFNDLIFIL